LARKSLTLLLVATGSFMSHSMHLGIDVGSTVAMAFAANELISITENCARAGVPIPESLLIVVVRAKKLAGRSKTPAEVEEELSAALGEAQKTK
jgi:phage-related holin